MSLRTKLTLFTLTIIIMVVSLTSWSTTAALRSFLREEKWADHLTWFKIFRSVCLDAVFLSDDLAIRTYSESLEHNVPGLAYAVYTDLNRPGIKLGGRESLERFGQLAPRCDDPDPVGLSFQPEFRLESTGQLRWRHYCDRITRRDREGNDVRGVVFFGINANLVEERLDNDITRMHRWLVGVMVVVLLVGLILSFLLGRTITKPIRHLTEGAKAIGEGFLETQIPVESRDELGFLAQEFNLMAFKLRELDQLKDDFVSSVSHELRSPLSAISGYVELLRSKPLDKIAADKREKALGIIQESTVRLTRFINDILDLAKLKAGQVELREGALDLRLCAEDLQTLFQPLFDRKSITFSADVPASIPTLTGDEDKIRQVLTNLFSNALKFTPSGGKIRMLARNQMDFIQVSVQDTGVGIPEESKTAVFERFRQAKNAGEVIAGQRGTGLGLAIAKGIVELHGGRIWLESELGKGTTVHFTLPNRPAPDSSAKV